MENPKTHPPSPPTHSVGAVCTPSVRERGGGRRGGEREEGEDLKAHLYLSHDHELKGVETLSLVLPLLVHHASLHTQRVLRHLCGKEAVHDEKLAYTCRNALWEA